MLISLDVSNAFKTAPWIRIDEALQSKSLPAYMIRIFRSYLESRTLLVGPDLKRRNFTCKVPQGSVLGLALWNAFYEGLLTMRLPSGVHLVAFADDVAVVATAHTGELLQRLVNPVLA